MRAERPSADRADAVLAQLDDLLALRADVPQLLDAAPAASSPLPVCRAPNRSARPRELAESRRALAAPASATPRPRSRAPARPRSLMPARAAARSPWRAWRTVSISVRLRPASCGAPVEPLELGLERRKRRQLASKRLQLGARGRCVGQLAIDPRDLALDGRQLAVGEARFGGERLRALALALQRLPSAA